MERYFLVEFYDRTNGCLEHNGEYKTMDDAFADAYGREVVCTGIVHKDKYEVTTGGNHGDDKL